VLTGLGIGDSRLNSLGVEKLLSVCYELLNLCPGHIELIGEAALPKAYLKFDCRVFLTGIEDPETSEMQGESNGISQVSETEPTSEVAPPLAPPELGRLPFARVIQ
jgi:hypothetical protein